MSGVVVVDGDGDWDELLLPLLLLLLSLIFALLLGDASFCGSCGGGALLLGFDERERNGAVSFRCWFVGQFARALFDVALQCFIGTVFENLSERFDIAHLLLLQELFKMHRLMKCGDVRRVVTCWVVLGIIHCVFRQCACNQNCDFFVGQLSSQTELRPLVDEVLTQRPRLGFFLVASLLLQLFFGVVVASAKCASSGGAGGGDCGSWTFAADPPETVGGCVL